MIASLKEITEEFAEFLNANLKTNDKLTLAAILAGVVGIIGGGRILGVLVHIVLILGVSYGLKYTFDLIKETVNLSEILSYQIAFYIYKLLIFIFSIIFWSIFLLKFNIGIIGVSIVSFIIYFLLDLLNAKMYLKVERFKENKMKIVFLPFIGQTAIFIFLLIRQLIEYGIY